jgi:hypothetical protein
MTKPDGKGYEFPDPVDPGELYCFRVYVPKNPLYLGAFWNAYYYFTLWVAWARDPFHKGKDVANVWRRAVDRARAEFDKQKGDCEMAITGIRQNPLDKCKIQTQEDGGAWVDTIDMSCCGGSGGGCTTPLRVGPQGQIQEYNSDTRQWTDTAPGENQTTTGSTPPEFATDPNARCIASVNYSEYVKLFLEKMLTVAQTAVSVGELSLEAVQMLSLLFGIPGEIIALLGTLFTGIYAGAGSVNEARLAAQDNADILCYFFRRMHADGTMPGAEIGLLVSDLQAAGAAEPDENIKWWFIHAADLVSIWGQTGVANGVKQPGDPLLNCDSCETVVHLDFGSKVWGFVKDGPDFYGNREGKQTMGVGLETTGPSPDNAKLGYSITLDANIVLKHVKIEWSRFFVMVGNPENVMAFTGIDSVTQIGIDPPSGTTTITEEDIADVDTYTVHVGAAAGSENTFVEGDITQVHYVELTFTGPCPDVWQDARV